MRRLLRVQGRAWAQQPAPPPRRVEPGVRVATELLRAVPQSWGAPEGAPARLSARGPRSHALAGTPAFMRERLKARGAQSPFAPPLLLSFPRDSQRPPQTMRAAGS